MRELNKFSEEKDQKYADEFIKSHKIGDIVKIKGTLIGTRFPRYLEGGTLEIVGFTKQRNVKCQWDKDTVFNISPVLLKDVK